MEDLRSPGSAVSLSKESATGKAVFSGVFGSPPRFDPSAARPGDYAEVFGDLDDSSSIPFLDLPPAWDGLDVATLPSLGFGFDYSEVFGGRDPQRCAASYEEIFLVLPRGEYACSSKGRSTEESTSSHQARNESKHSPAHSSGSHMEWEEGHHLSPNSTSAYNVSTQISVSYSKSSRGIKEGAVTGETHITKLHAFPAFSFVVDSDTTSGNGHFHNIEKDGLGNENEQNKSEATFSNTSKNFLRANQKHPTAKSPASGNDNANTSDNFCGSEISTTSGLVSSCDAIFMNASDFSLLTQPMEVSPPSKSPPKFVDKKGHPKPRILSTSKICTDEVDDSSAAASAAVVEAIEFAQAKLKIAKELMEKKRDGPRKSKKLGHHESLKHNEQKLGQARVGQESFGELLIALEKRNGITSAAKNAEKDNARALNKEEEQEKKEKDLELCALHKKSASKCMFLKMNDKYHELVNSEKYKTEEVSQTEDLIEKTKIMRKNFVVKQNEIVNDSLSSEIECNRKLRKGSIAPVACVHYETDFLEAQGCDVKEEVLEAQGVIKAQCAGEKTPFAGCEKNIEPSDHYTLHYSHDDKEENITAGLSVEASEEKSSYNFVQIAKPAELVKEINKSNIGSASNGEEKLNEISEAAAQLGFQVPQKLCISHQQATEAFCMHIVSKKTNRAESQNDTENERGGTLLMHKEGKREEILMKGQSCSTIENELRLETDQETDELEKDLKKWNSTAETHEESSTTVKATKVASWPDCNVDKASDILVELQQKYKKEDSTPKPSSIVDLEGNNENNRDVQVSGNEGTIEIHVDHQFMDKIVCLNAVPGIYKGPLDTSLGFQSIGLSDNRGELSYLAVVTMEDQPVTSQTNILDINKINQNKMEFMKDREQTENPITKREENERLFEEAKEMNVELVEEEQSRLTEVKERQKEEEEAQLMSLHAKERERKLEEKDSARLCEAKERECKVEEESENYIEEDKVSRRKLQNVNGSAKTSEENDLMKGEDRHPLERETHEVQRRAFAEAREITVRKYIHTVISEALGKLSVEVQEKAEKSSYEYLEKSTQKASVKAMLIPEGTGVELTTSQVHEYAAERVFAESVASDYDKKNNTTSRDSTKKEIVTEGNLIFRDERFNLDDQGDAQSLCPGSFDNSQAITEPDGQHNKNFGEGEPALKCQVMMEKNQRISERAAKALAEMNMREDLAQREQAERNRLGEYLDFDIRRWSNGKEGNLRALLSTLQYILGPDSGWQPVSLMDIITASAVKRVYRKATLCVHPDKLQQRDASVQQKYICEKVFDLLKDAWNKFNLEDR